LIKVSALTINRILFLFVVIIVSVCGVNGYINLSSNYHNNNNNNKPSAIPLILIATADEETSNRNNNNLNSDDGKKDTNSYIGVNVRGLYTSLQHERYPSAPTPLLEDYYNKSFKLISEAGMNHIRYVFYWEAYERNPQLFMNELDTVANFADKWKLNVLYDNHQYHTSSWLDPKNGTGFPESLFRSNIDASSLIYRKGSGGEPKDESAQVWWSKWWDRTIKDTEGNDGWTRQANFLKRIIQEVDKHPSTLGYEILNEPQIHNDNQWSKVGKYNTFMADELRKVTEKTIAYSQQIPTSLRNSAISMTPQNIAKMAPNNKTNVVFKFTTYGEPIPNTYQGNRFSIFVKAGKIAGVPIYIGEWNNVKREKVNDDESNIVYQINSEKSDLTQKQAVRFLEDFKEVGIWGWAYWNWNLIPHPAANVNLMTVTENGDIDTTKYYDILKHAISSS
jgi:hypothetical protein